MACPLEIEILMHYAVVGSDYRDGDFSAPAVADAIENFKFMGLLADSDHTDHVARKLMPTEGTRVYLGALCAVPFPVQQWVIPHHLTVSE